MAKHEWTTHGGEQMISDPFEPPTMELCIASSMALWASAASSSSPSWNLCRPDVNTRFSCDRAKNYYLFCCVQCCKSFAHEGRRDTRIFSIFIVAKKLLQCTKHTRILTVLSLGSDESGSEFRHMVQTLNYNIEEAVIRSNWVFKSLDFRLEIISESLCIITIT